MTDSGRHVPRRPAHFGPDALEAHGGTLPGPAEVTEIAHQTAAVIVGTGRAAADPAVTARLVALVDDLGLSTIADLWAGRPARSLPGALWRLYALREWVRRQPVEASRQYAAGIRFTEVGHAVAGVAEPPGPEEVRALADGILTGVFAGDLAVALERAGAFASVVAAGRADLAHDRDRADPAAAGARPTHPGARPRPRADHGACARRGRARAPPRGPRGRSPPARRRCSAPARTSWRAPAWGGPTSWTDASLCPPRRGGRTAYEGVLREHRAGHCALGSGGGAGPRQPRVPNSAATSGHAP